MMTASWEFVPTLSRVFPITDLQTPIKKNLYYFTVCIYIYYIDKLVYITIIYIIMCTLCVIIQAMCIILT